MIGPVENLATSGLRRSVGIDLPDMSAPTIGLENRREVRGLSQVNPQAKVASFESVLGNAVNEVNTKMQTAEVEKARVMSGESNNLHQAVLSMQEAGVAFSLMSEVRNKLVESYQEIMRMQV